MPDRRICPWDRKLPPWAWPSRLLPTTTSSDLTILNEIKVKGSYREVRYDHAGPAHLSMGQEAAAVGMAFALTPDDHIFGSHRAHGEILAKAFSAIRQLSDARLVEIMEAARGGL